MVRFGSGLLWLVWHVLRVWVVVLLLGREVGELDGMGLVRHGDCWG